ncbi:LOW QUALITY PROTEIN: hypothetical protein PFNF54_01021 [Plasmodium falciparum NF54]|uniref:Uncharacterized protein n=1 Tax=Plasmodium falciparum (isolate NF54) TaxID=5843 RepID=W7JYX6_PLAFO|nr:LOW QUALITY PROTEIN: hypothetical protein PFNF54_01021 [Plasmodium falciparum NF54]
MYFRSFGRTNFSMFAIHAKIFRIENNDWVTFRKYFKRTRNGVNCNTYCKNYKKILSGRKDCYEKYKTENIKKI